MVSDAFSCNIQRGVNYNDLLRWQRAGFTQGGQGSVINNAQRDNINAVCAPAVKMAAEEVFKINLLNLFTIFFALPLCCLGLFSACSVLLLVKLQFATTQYRRHLFTGQDFNNADEACG